MPANDGKRTKTIKLASSGDAKVRKKDSSNPNDRDLIGK
jgi:hypothetical protein